MTVKAKLFFCLLLVTWIAGCGGATVVKQIDPLELLAAGDYIQARTFVESRGIKEAEDRGIVAIAMIANNPTADVGEEAVDILTKGTSPVGAAASATTMLELAFVLPSPINVETSSIIVEAALGATGHGPLADKTMRDTPAGVASKTVAVYSLERIELALSSPEASSIDTGRLLVIWNGCYRLLGGSLETNNELQAWKLFKSIGILGVSVAKELPESDLAKVLLGSAIAVIENNPDIAIAARCDMASPFDKIRTAVFRALPLRARLEASVAAAAGCNRGIHAPQVD